MKKTLLCLSLAAVASCVKAQKPDPIQQKYAAYITAEDARKHLSILASDAFEGRETGKPGAEKAANYIAAEFKKLGLQAPVNGSYFLNVPLAETSLLADNFKINNTDYTSGKDFYISGNASSKNIAVKEVVFIGYGISSENYDDLKNVDLAGKVIMYINKGEPMKNGISAVSKTATASDWSTNRNKRIQYLFSKNPALVLSINPDLETLLQRMAQMNFNPSAGRIAIKSETKAPDRPAVITISPKLADAFLKSSGKTLDALKTAIDQNGTPQTQTVKADFSVNINQQNKDVKAVDVLGYLPGTDLKDEVLVISAHYDHIGLTTSGTDKVNNGADDDGSGTTGVLEIARAFTAAKKAGHGPRRSILFLGNVGEEKGLLGSEYYTDHPVFPLEKTITDLNIDMIGRVGEEYKGKPDSADYIYVIGSSKLSSTLHDVSEKTNQIYTKMKLDYKYDDPKDPNRFYYRSDHYNFAKHNVPIIFYFNGVHEDYHRPGDEVSKINFPALAKRAQLVFYTGWDLANRDKRPAVDAKNDMTDSQ
ncbi:MAG: M28 family peptidase [Sphingobacteriaceae bacterium]|nr:MAG: M28 family peptidase [Sphingobacteriaceae bacterium]